MPEIPPPPHVVRDKKIMLKGPTSPLEIPIYPTAEAARNKSVEIDKHSVNAVLLGNDPQDASEKYLVAASVTQGKNNNLTVRHTTLMPNIRGFGPIVASIFCPTMVMYRFKNNNK